MNTPQQLFFFTNYKAIESDIINGYDKVSHLSDKSESTRRLFHQQIEGLDNQLVLDYIGYIKKMDIDNFFKREGLIQLKSYLQSIEYKIKLSTPLPKPQLHFTCSFTQEQLKLIYKGLTTDGFLPIDETGADFKAFCYIFGYGKQEDFKYLDWIGLIKDLNAFINTFYNGERAKWEKTVNCFKWENNPINKNSLKTANDAYDEDPPSKEYFKTLKKKIQ